MVVDDRLGSCFRSGLRLGYRLEYKVRAGFGFGNGLGLSLGLNLGSGVRGSWIRQGEGASRYRVGSWNISTLHNKSIELVKILKKRKISIAYVQEMK